MAISLALLCLQCLLPQSRLLSMAWSPIPPHCPPFSREITNLCTLSHKAQKVLSNHSGSSSPPALGALPSFTLYYLLLSKLCRQTLWSLFHLLLCCPLGWPQTNGCILHFVQAGWHRQVGCSTLPVPPRLFILPQQAPTAQQSLRCFTGPQRL